MISLYLHGLNSTNLNDRTKWLEQFGRVINPLMSYRNLPADYRVIEKLIKKYRPQVIVGSSMGGYFGFHLGNYFGIPTVLFNPALIMTTIVNPVVKPMAVAGFHYISLGMQDDIIPPHSTKALLNYWQVPFQIYPINLGHETPFKVFTDVCQKTGLFQ